MKRLFILLGMLFAITTVFSQNIVKAEYFIDVDPGAGHGIQLPNFVAGDTVNFNATIPTAALSDGFHYLGVRVADANGTWSRYESRGFYLASTTATNVADIVAAEFFIDFDPGPGMGWPVTIAASGPVVNFTAISPVPLTPGFHFISMRVKDGDGKWSLFEQRGFYVTPFSSNMPALAAAEYFYDTDPGPGNGIPLELVLQTDSINQQFIINAPTTLTGQHFLGIRVKDFSGNWSFFAYDTVNIAAQTFTCPGNVTVAAPAGQCSAIVNNISPTVSPAINYNYTLTGATNGSGSGSASGLSFNPGVTTVTYSATNAPTVSCSFTVTVTTNIVPSVSIDAPTTTTCPGSSLTFTAHPTNGGGNPSYQWKKNGVNVGTNSNVFQTNVLSNGDVITVVMTSSISCASPTTATSNAITVTVTQPNITPTVTLTASTTAVCYNSTVTFNASTTNGGTPNFAWYINNVWMVTNMDSSYEASNLVAGDVVKVVMTSSMACVTTTTVVSNTITMTAGGPTPSVTITASATTICPGTLVTFNATPTNGGNPHYQWRVNGNTVGNDSPTWQSSTLQNGDSVVCYMGSSLPCVTQPLVLSNTIFITTTQTVAPSVTIQSTATNICAGTVVTFTATPVNGGSSPVYEWIVNTGAVNTPNSNIFQTSTLHDGDKVKVTMVSSLGCATPGQAVSNTITMNVSNAITPSFVIAPSSQSICAGTLVTFNAYPVSGAGDHPSYQWKLNGNNVGTDSSVWQSSSLSNGDVIRAVMTSSLGCASPATVLSFDSITMTVSSTPVTPSVTIIADHDSICPGTLVTFSAQPINGGDVPDYKWKLNGNNVGFDLDTYTTDSLHNGDVVKVVMNSSIGCTTEATVTSNPITVVIQSLKTYYADYDGDGYGNPASGSIQSCSPPSSSYVLTSTDCDDFNAAIHPGATEICGNNIDDNCNGQIDENCTTGLPTLVPRTYPAKEGDAGVSILTVEVALDKPAQLPVSIHYATSNEDALAGQDYFSASGELLIPAGDSIGRIQLRIIGDLLKESNERFKLNFSNPVNVLLPADPVDRIMIIDDDKGRGNHEVATTGRIPAEDELLQIRAVAKRNQVWTIPQIEKYENDISIFNSQGQLVKKFVNYKNQISLNNVPAGLYFYRIVIVDGKNQVKNYSGRLLITE